jgi:hypothetical protein
MPFVFKTPEQILDCLRAIRETLIYNTTNTTDFDRGEIIQYCRDIMNEAGRRVVKSKPSKTGFKDLNGNEV